MGLRSVIETKLGGFRTDHFEKPPVVSTETKSVVSDLHRRREVVMRATIQASLFVNDITLSTDKRSSDEKLYEAKNRLWRYIASEIYGDVLRPIHRMRIAIEDGDRELLYKLCNEIEDICNDIGEPPP